MLHSQISPVKVALRFQRAAFKFVMIAVEQSEMEIACIDARYALLIVGVFDHTLIPDSWLSLAV